MAARPRADASRRDQQRAVIASVKQCDERFGQTLEPGALVDADGEPALVSPIPQLRARNSSATDEITDYEPFHANAAIDQLHHVSRPWSAARPVVG